VKHALTILPDRAPGAEARLDTLARHACVRIARIEADNDDMTRLKAMGVCAGRQVEVVQPGDPMILRVFGSRIGLSARLARQIFAAPCDETTCAARD
jgi:Fe2+ transport system protein FeoA